MGKSLQLISRLLLASVFLVSGGIKWNDPERFLLDLQAMEILPYAVAFAVSLVLPVLEILIAIGILLRRLYFGSLIIYGTLCFGFIAVILWGTMMNKDFDCGCFGDWFVFPNVWAHAGFNGFLIGVVAYLIYDGASPTNKQSRASKLSDFA